MLHSVRYYWLCSSGPFNSHLTDDSQVITLDSQSYFHHSVRYRCIRFWVCVSMAEGIAVRSVDRLWRGFESGYNCGLSPTLAATQPSFFPFRARYYQDFLFLLLSLCYTPLHYSAVYFIPFHLKKHPPAPFQPFRHLLLLRCFISSNDVS
jgi:hypothetical protein